MRGVREADEEGGGVVLLVGGLLLARVLALRDDEMSAAVDRFGDDAFECSHCGWIARTDPGQHALKHEGGYVYSGNERQWCPGTWRPVKIVRELR
jgi:hypothetical protein